MVEISRLFWKKVYTSDGYMLGEIESGELNLETWQIDSFYVSLSEEATKALGFKRPFLGKIMVCLPVSNISDIEERAVLNKTIQELSNLKECKE